MCQSWGSDRRFDFGVWLLSLCLFLAKWLAHTSKGWGLFISHFGFLRSSLLIASPSVYREIGLCSGFISCSSPAWVAGKDIRRVGGGWCQSVVVPSSSVCAVSALGLREWLPPFWRAWYVWPAACSFGRGKHDWENRNRVMTPFLRESWLNQRHNYRCKCVCGTVLKIYWGGWDGLGDWDWYIYTAIYKIGN